MDTTHDNLLGTTLDRRYRIDQLVGTGGMAKVYRATDETLGRQVAIKLLAARYAHDDAFVERFMREASSAAKLNHPNIVQVYDRGEAEGSYYIAMEYVDGTTLKEVIRSRGALSEQDAIAYGRQALQALRFAHRNGIVHRDIKPHNMMVDSEGRLKIADFGIARAGSDAGLTEVGSIVGTAQYLSPEQAQGLTVSASSDLYSLGVVLFEMCTGRVPYEGDSPVNVALRQVNDPIPSPRMHNPQVSQALEAIIVRAMQKDPAARYATADEMLADLDGAQSGSVSEQTTRVLVGAAVAGSTRPTTMQTAVQPVLPAIPLDASSSYAEAAAFGEEPDRDQEPGSSRRWLWIMLAVLVLGGGVAAWFLLGSTSESTTVKVPDVVGLQQKDAERRITDSDLRVGDISFETDTEAKAGTVLEQEPGSSERVDARTRIDLVVSSGPELSDMPNLVGRTKEEAERLLASNGITNIQVTEEFSDSAARDAVIRQEPAAGERIAGDTSVKLVVSKGPENTMVPDVTGSQLDAARTQLEEAGFEVTIERQDGPDATDQVLDQSVTANQKAKTGSTIVLTVASGYNNVPRVVDMTSEEAITAIEEAGFEALTTSDTEDPSLNLGDPDRVVTQSPVSGRRKVGSTVGIKVVHAPDGP